MSIAILCLSLLPTLTQARGEFGKGLCRLSGYSCVKIRSSDSWASLFPNQDERLIVKKVNRMNTPLHSGMTIAVPKNLGQISVMDVSPFPHTISAPGRTLIKVNLGDLAWGAYDAEGKLLNWGPVSGGKDYCPDIRHGCRTPAGSFTVFDKQGEGCISHKFPLPNGGAPMPYCMHFSGGYALHGSATVPGFNASHGCVRMYPEDAEWLNHEFVETGSTRVIITH